LKQFIRSPGKKDIYSILSYIPSYSYDKKVILVKKNMKKSESESLNQQQSIQGDKRETLTADHDSVYPKAQDAVVSDILFIILEDFFQVIQHAAYMSSHARSSSSK
jgi:hypothetical protein